MLRKLGIVTLILALLVAVFYYFRPRDTAVVATPQTQQPTAPPKSSVVLHLSNDQTASKVVTEVQRIIRPKRAAFAVSSGQSPRLACVFVENPERYFQLDSGVDAANFPFLKEMNFAEPPEPLARTISRYKSVSMSAMDYNFERGDRLIVLLCPADDWEKLNLECTNFSLPIAPPNKPKEIRNNF